MANSWVNKEHIDMYMDRTRNARFSFYEYAIAFREVQSWFLDKKCMDEKSVRNDLYTLVKTVTPTTTLISQSQADDLTVNHVDYPADYYYFSNLLHYIGGSLIESKPTNYNQLNNILLDPFRKPSNEKCYVLEDATGWKVYRGYGGAYTNSLTYLISPSEWSIGTESDLINPGLTLTPGVNYTATADSVVGGTKYEPGEQFTPFIATLTSGQVIPTSVLVDSNFPDSVQNEICRITAAFLQGSVKDAFGANFSGQIAQTDIK